jgi:hypothetical protein
MYMPISFVSKLGAGIAMACVMLTTHAQVSDTRWQLRVMDLNHQVRVEGTIRLTDDPETKSCMAGHWKIAVVEERVVSDEKFFPLSEPLAYEIDNGTITLGRTRICDDYLFMNGKFDDKTISGTYDAPGLPGLVHDQGLGYFSLTKIQ